MKIVPHFYQEESVQAIFDYFKSQFGNPVVVMPTGTGKSIVISHFCKTVLAHFPNQRIMIATHVQELVEQNCEKFMRMWPMGPAGVYAAGLDKRETHRAITFASIQSVAKRAAEFGHIDLLMIDEAHLVSDNDATMYQTLVADLRKVNPFLKVIGLTATPWRLGKGRLTDKVKGPDGKEVPGLFTDICYDISGVSAFNKLVDMGFLLPLVTKRTALELKTDGVGTRGGDFIEADLQRAVNKQEITAAALLEALELGHDRRSWLIFCAGVDHADDTASILTHMGVECRAVHSKIKKSERKKILQDFKSGRLRAVANNNVLTTGFDHPGLDLIIVLRPTQSAVLWVQMLGRGTRCDYAPGFDLTTLDGRIQAILNSHKQDCMVLDFAYNAKRLGPINDPVPPRKKGEKGGNAPVKACDVCGTWNHASVRWCGGKSTDDPAYSSNLGCGAEFKFQFKVETTASDFDVQRDDFPIMEVFKVDHVTYSLHEKMEAEPMMKVTYYCGYKNYTEYVCPQHSGYALRKAQEWWQMRCDYSLPGRTDAVIQLAASLPPATHIRVHTNKKFPEIKAHCFDGSAFGAQAAYDSSATMPTVQTSAKSTNPWAKKKAEPAVVPSDPYEDDIPF